VNQIEGSITYRLLLCVLDNPLLVMLDLVYLKCVMFPQCSGFLCVYACMLLHVLFTQAVHENKALKRAAYQVSAVQDEAVCALTFKVT
jgi:hypothetical protein